MLWTIAIILLVLWALGLLTHVAGGLIHLLLVVSRHNDCAQPGPARPPNRVTD